MITGVLWTLNCPQQQAKASLSSLESWCSNQGNKIPSTNISFSLFFTSAASFFLSVFETSQVTGGFQKHWNHKATPQLKSIVVKIRHHPQAIQERASRCHSWKGTHSGGSAWNNDILLERPTLNNRSVDFRSFTSTTGQGKETQREGFKESSYGL